MTTIEARVRSMTKAERRAYLIERGWRRLGQSWLHHTHDNVNGDRAFYSLAAAIRTALADEDAP